MELEITLVLLPDKVTNTIKEDIYISLHEYAEIRLFPNIFCLQLYGPEDYFSSSDFYIKLDNENIIYGIQASESYKYDQDDEIYGIGYGKRFQLDDMIDKNQFEKSDYILQGLEELRNCGEEELEIWALNKLSEVYLKGFGSISADLKLAIDFCQEAMTLNSHKAYSNMAAAFLYGIGVEKNLEKALKLIEKAHQISKTPTELDVFINKKRKRDI